LTKGIVFFRMRGKSQMWERLTAPDKTVFKTPLFLISFWLPVVLSIIMFGLIAASDGLTLSIMGGSEAYSLMVERMKVPLIVLSLSVPLSGLVISNHRSMQLVKTIQGQERKRMYDLYYDHQKELCITLGRVIETEGWVYIEKEDLPLIHRSVYRHNVDQKNDSFPSSKTVIKALESFVEQSNSYLGSQEKEISRHITKDNFESALDAIAVTFEVLVSNINRLRAFILVRPLESSEKYVNILKAICELDILKGWLREDIVEEYRTTFDESRLNELLIKVAEYSGFSPTDLDKGCLIAAMQLKSFRENAS